MRWLGWASVLCILLLVQSGIADAGCTSCNGNDSGSYRSYRGSACCAPPGYSLAPGCCECPPSACDNAWDGYCEEKAKWQAFFTKVGTPRQHCHGCPCMVPGETCSNCADIHTTVEQQPTPAAKSTVPPASPAPSPNKATWKSTSLWFR